ncbi:MAG: WD40/YVTN/BNR-like repeat-containing protein [Phycisphaeraceae bacterium]
MTTLHLATGDGPIILTPRGDTWQGRRPLDVLSASCVACDPARPERVFCTTVRDGAWRSDDAGATWQRVFDGAGYARLTSVAVSGVQHAGGVGVVYLGTEPSAILRSEDAGVSWSQCSELTDLPSSNTWSFPPRPETHHVRWITPDPHETGRVHAAIEAGAMLLSPDGGATWRDRVPGGPRDTHQLVTHPGLPDRLWSSAGDGFFESFDGGASWQHAERGLEHRYCWSVAIDPHEANGLPTIVISAAAGPRQAHDKDQAEGHLYRRSGGNAPWEEVTAGLPDPRGTRTWALAADPAQAGVFYAGSDGAMFRSTDAGASWQQMSIDWPDGYTGKRIHVVTAAAAQ